MNNLYLIICTIYLTNLIHLEVRLIMGKKCLAVSAQTIDTGGKDAAKMRKKNIRAQRNQDIPCGQAIVVDDDDEEADPSATTQSEEDGSTGQPGV